MPVTLEYFYILWSFSSDHFVRTVSSRNIAVSVEISQYIYRVQVILERHPRGHFEVSGVNFSFSSILMRTATTLSAILLLVNGALRRCCMNNTKRLIKRKRTKREPQWVKPKTFQIATFIMQFVKIIGDIIDWFYP